MPIPDIYSISVYDPRSEGIDFVTYMSMIKENYDSAIEKQIALISVVGDSQIPGVGTLDEYLHGEDGYFALHSAVTGVIFVNGKFHSKFLGWKNQLVSEEIEDLGRKENGIPFVYTRTIYFDSDIMNASSKEAFNAIKAMRFGN